jgi:hypothetical protein
MIARVSDERANGRIGEQEINLGINLGINYGYLIDDGVWKERIDVPGSLLRHRSS